MAERIRSNQQFGNPLVVAESFGKFMILFFKKEPILLHRIATLSSTFPRDSRRMFEWKKSLMCSAPTSLHNTQNKRVHKGARFDVINHRYNFFQDHG